MKKLQRFRDAMERRWQRFMRPDGRTIEKEDYHAHLVRCVTEHPDETWPNREVRVETWYFYPWPEENVPDYIRPATKDDFIPGAVIWYAECDPPFCDVVSLESGPYEDDVFCSIGSRRMPVKGAFVELKGRK